MIRSNRLTIGSHSSYFGLHWRNADDSQGSNCFSGSKYTKKRRLLGAFSLFMHNRMFISMSSLTRPLLARLRGNV